MSPRLLATFGIAAAIAAVGAGCGGDDKQSDSSSSAASSGAKGEVSVYSSFPLQGAAATQSRAVLNGEKLALKQAGNKAGDFKVKFVSLDDSTAQAGTWDPGQVSQNARKAVSDSSAVAYVGEFNSGATVVSLPILNDGGDPPGQPVEHLRRPHAAGRRRGAREVLPHRQANLRPSDTGRRHPGRGAGQLPAR